VTNNFFLTWLQIRGSHNPFLGFHHLLEQFTELKKALTSCLPANYVIGDMIKGIDKQPDEEIHREGIGRVPNTGASVPVELGYVTLLANGCAYQP